MTRTSLSARAKSFAIALLGLVMLIPSVAAAQAPKIGYVDLQRALNEVEEGKTERAKLKKDFEGKQKKLDKKQKELLKLKEELEQGGMMMKEDVKREKALKYQKGLIELQQMHMAMQRELVGAEQKATRKIFKKMEGIIINLAKEGKYDLVLERTESAVLFAKESMDMTAELIKRYNASK